MKSSKYAFVGFAMIVLYEYVLYFIRFKFFLDVGVHKKSSFISKNLRSNQDNIVENIVSLKGECHII